MVPVRWIPQYPVSVLEGSVRHEAAATFRAKYGDRLLTPELMPPATVDLDLLPAALEQAATGEIDVEGYHQPAVQIRSAENRSCRQKSGERSVSG